MLWFSLTKFPLQTTVNQIKIYLHHLQNISTIIDLVYDEKVKFGLQSLQFQNKNVVFVKYSVNFLWLQVF